MGKSRAPKPPDPIKTEQGQTATNIGTAIANQVGSQTNQVTPDGSLTYSQTGTYAYTDPLTGDVYDIPQWTATQTLSPQQQQIADRTGQTEINLAQLAQDQSGRLNSLLSAPVEIGNEAVESRLFELGRARLDPLMADRRDQMNTELVNRGIGAGSEAYDREMRRLMEGENDAYNSLLLSGRGQAVQEQLAERNQPINEITALLSGSQVSQPNFLPTPGMNAPTTDYAGLVQNNYAQQVAAANANNNRMGGLFGNLIGTAGTLGGAAIIASDERVKDVKERVGETDGGVPLYRYRYKGEYDDGREHIGPMAQDVARKQPKAAVRMGDILGVNYEALR